MEFLTKKVPKLTDIVTFGSVCTVYVDARNKSLGDRGGAAIVISKSDETKGYKVFVPKDKVILVTQHVQNIDSLSSDEHLDPHQDGIRRQEGSTMVNRLNAQGQRNNKRRTDKHRKFREPS
uniref:Retroviral polymerase SH3-like domain-containing protein n=1 Tax=Peronospora matthiolae TaxID=2874970 RepID=A0AAV1U9K1_9STRA